MSVTVEITTKGRYYDTLPLTLMSIVNQTKKPDKIIIIDDNNENERIDLRNNAIYDNILQTMDYKGINWEVLFGNGQGQVIHHQYILDNADTKYVWRIDDDEVAELNVLEELYNKISESDNIGAVGCRILFPNNIIEYDKAYNYNDIFFDYVEYKETLPVEWTNFKEVKKAKHLYSSFIYNVENAKKSGGYVTDLPIVAHKEETLFTHRLYVNNYKLYVIPTATIYHYKNKKGGIRTHNDNIEEQFYISELIARRYIMEWHNIKLENDDFICVISNGIGDNYAFKNILIKLLKKHKDKNVIVFTYYKDVFLDIDAPNLILNDIISAQSLNIDINKYDVYNFMISNKWDGHIIDAYKKIYNCE